MSLLLHHSKPQHHIDNACGAGGQFVSKPRSRGFTWADGVPARLWLCYLAVFLDPAGLWLWRGGPCHPQEVDTCPTKTLQLLKNWDGFRLNVLFICFTHSEGPSRDVVLHLTTGRIHNKNVSTHLIGSISKGTKQESSCFIADVLMCHSGNNSGGLLCCPRVILSGCHSNGNLMSLLLHLLLQGKVIATIWEIKCDLSPKRPEKTLRRM